MLEGATVLAEWRERLRMGLGGQAGEMQELGILYIAGDTYITIYTNENGTEDQRTNPS